MSPCCTVAGEGLPPAPRKPLPAVHASNYCRSLIYCWIDVLIKFWLVAALLPAAFADTSWGEMGGTEGMRPDGLVCGRPAPICMSY